MKYPNGLMDAGAVGNGRGRGAACDDPSGTLMQRLASLTPREREVADQLVHGKSNKRIADDLRIAEATVAVHLKKILGKLGVHNRRDAACCVAGDARYGPSS